MRVDLRLQSVQFCSAALLLLPDDVVHQFIDLAQAPLHASSKVFHFRRSADVYLVRIYPASVHILDRAVQPQDRACDPFRHKAVDQKQSQDRHEQDQKCEKLCTDRAQSEAAHRNDADQFPSRITDRLDDYHPAFALKDLFVQTVFIIRRGKIILLVLFHTDLDHSGMIDQLSVPVAQVKVLIGVAPVDAVHHLLDRVVVHVDEQDSPDRHSAVSQFYNPAERNDPVISER